jgi:hypothetical protein
MFVFLYDPSVLSLIWPNLGRRSDPKCITICMGFNGNRTVHRSVSSGCCLVRPIFCSERLNC